MRRLVLLTVPVLLLAACSTDAEVRPAPTTTSPAETPDPTPSPTDGAAASPEPTPAPTSESPSDGATAAPPETPSETSSPLPVRAPFRADTSDDRGDGSGFGVTLTDLRLGDHDGYDRVVFELDGDGSAGWHVRYVDEATAHGSGHRVDLAGGAVLEVTLDNTLSPADSGVEEYDGPRELAGSGTVVEVELIGWYEGYTQAFIGVDAERPFRAFALDDRIVVDVRAD